MHQKACRTDGRTDEQPRSNMPLQLLWSWGHKNLVLRMFHMQFELSWPCGFREEIVWMFHHIWSWQATWKLIHNIFITWALLFLEWSRSICLAILEKSIEFPVWFGHSLLAARATGFFSVYQQSVLRHEMCRLLWDVRCVQNDLNLRISYMLENTFLLDLVHFSMLNMFKS